MCEGWLGLGGNLGKSTDSAIHQTVGDTALYCSQASAGGGGGGGMQPGQNNRTPVGKRQCSAVLRYRAA